MYTVQAVGSVPRLEAAAQRPVILRERVISELRWLAGLTPEGAIADALARLDGSEKGRTKRERWLRSVRACIMSAL